MDFTVEGGIQNSSSDRNARIGPTRHARTEGTRVFLVGLVLRWIS